ncbi:MAG TPA: Gfo/Idh/MocA family oxidoreductase [Candidatus Binatia bacterium]|nr:Gfo/Idh/MocA family oxidoreductase [Candidatus Binatia bacterium]
MQTGNTVRIAVVGLGRAGTAHLDAWKSIPGVEVVAACDPAPGARRSALTQGMKAYADLQSLLSNETLDAVSICTPPADHVRQAVECFERGLHVLCEQPLAVSTREAVTMFRAATRKRCQLSLATKLRHVPEVIRARELIRNGAIGEPLAFELSFCAPVDMSRRWNAEPSRSGGGVLIDNGCDAFEVIGFLLGAVARVHATVLKPLQRLAVEDSVTIEVEAQNGVVGRVDLSWSLAIGREAYVVVHGARGAIEIGWNSAALKLPGQDPRQIGAGYDTALAYREMTASFKEVIANARRRWITPLECLRTVAAVDAAYRSVRSGAWEWVDVEAASIPQAARGRAVPSASVGSASDPPTLTQVPLGARS